MGRDSSNADTHLLSDRGDTCSISATWLYKQQDWEEKDQSVSQWINDEAVCRTAGATPGLLISRIGTIFQEKVSKNMLAC